MAVKPASCCADACVVSSLRLRTGDLIAIGGSLVVLVGLFLPFYGTDLEVDGFGTATIEVSAWGAFELGRLLLGGLALGAAALLVAEAAGVLAGGGRRTAITLGTLAAGIVLFRMVARPLGDGLGLRVGALVLLAGAAAISLGAQLAARDR